MQPDNQGGNFSSTLSKVVFIETPSWMWFINCFITGYWVRSPLALPLRILYSRRWSRTSAPVSFKTRMVLFCANVILFRRSEPRLYKEERWLVKYVAQDTDRHLLRSRNICWVDQGRLKYVVTWHICKSFYRDNKQKCIHCNHWITYVRHLI